ncbi:MAG: hypothetical protein WDW38_009702 [Sanguina aurantia]
MEDELSDLTTCLDQSLASVTQLTIRLAGRDTGEVNNEVVNLAAAAVRILGPFCGPLTHITVCGEVVLEEVVYSGNAPTFTFTPLIAAAAAVCPSSLTHLSFSMQLRACWGSPAPLGKEQCRDLVPDGEFQVLLDSSACDALSSLTRLTHLTLEHGHITAERVWAALPPSLRRLGAHTLRGHAPACMALRPNLRELALERSSCSQLQELMAMCPRLTGLDLATLQMPCSPEELAGLGDIMSHPGWCANSGPSRGLGSAPVTELLQATRWECGVPVDGEGVLASLPVMPTITKFAYEHPDSGTHCPPPDPARLLHHITRAFPNLQTLHLSHIPRMDSEVRQLQACASLRQLDFECCDDLSGAAIRDLASRLPVLVRLEVEGCRCASGLDVAGALRMGFNADACGSGQGLAAPCPPS